MGRFFSAAFISGVLLVSLSTLIPTAYAVPGAGAACDVSGVPGTRDASGICIPSSKGSPCDVAGVPGKLDASGICIPTEKGSACDVNGVAGDRDASGICIPNSQRPVSKGSVTRTPKGIDLIYLEGYYDDITYVINDLLVPVLLAIAFIVFLYGVYKYFILGADNDTELETGRKFALYGIIGFVIIVSLWGIVWIVIDTFSLAPGGGAPPTPTL
jgi:hypothetical protein